MRRIFLASALTAILSALSLSGCASVGSSGKGSHPVAPSVTTQPASQTVTAGQTATFPDGRADSYLQGFQF